MALTILETEAVGTARLPIGALAARLRLPDGWETVPGHSERLADQLRSAIVSIERRTGYAMLGRSFVIGGEAAGWGDLALPVRPLTALRAFEVATAAGFEPVAGAILTGGRVALPYGAAGDRTVRIEVEAGHATWDEVPAPLREGAMLLAAALDGEAGTEATVRETIAPFRPVRLGRST
jgi:hypothetical protein